MWLRLSPVLQSGKDAVVALNDPVLLYGKRLHLGGSDGHAETNLQNPTAYQTEPRETITSENMSLLLLLLRETCTTVTFIFSHQLILRNSDG